TAQAAPPPAKPDPAPKPPKSAAPGAAPVKPAAAPAKAASRQLKLFVAAVIATGVGVAAAGFGAGWMSNPLTLVLLFGLALAAELMQIDLYGENTVSVSVAINFSAALIAGIPGVVCASAAIALAHAIRKRPALYKAVFNWAGYVLAQTPLLAVGLWAGPLDINRLPLLAPLVALAALACYAINTGLVAIAISLSERRNPLTFWRRQFQWLAGHYLVLGIVGLFLALAHLGFGLAGMLVFVLPVFMLRYAQKQYVERTQASMRELRRMNEELGAANQDAVSAALAIQKLNKHLEELNDELFETLARVIDARDPFVSGHAAKVVDYAVAIATELGLPPEQVRQVRQAAFLHDVGKIAISEEVLHKPGKLTAEEYEYMKSHAARGAELLETSQGLRHLAPFVRHHHERWDGRGYPHGLRGDAIPLEARIIAICDSVEAMASDRPYSRAKSLDDIVAEVARYRGTQFDPQIADVFLRIAQQQGDKLVVNSARQVVEQRQHDEVLLRQHDGWFGAQPRLDAASRG
ncbi:MAG TPA: HD-GYP domain-containing protein, partial [Ardenticatenaceae bacterium]|nr:HD-GYP domain-containing protein [Ardenticatenaceae bacterium]